MKPTHLTPLLLLALFAAAPVHADNFKELIEQGRYVELADKLEPHLNLDDSDEKLRAYLEKNLAYLRRGATPRVAGSEVLLVRGARNDRLYQMPNADGRKRRDDFAGLWDGSESYPSGGPRLMLPNRIRYARRSWDDRLPLIDRYFRESTTDMGGDGDSQRVLESIIAHHAGGGLGIHANSTASVLISTSTKPLWAFGPPYYIIKAAPERCIFNYKGLSGEFEVLLPFWVLPHEIVARCDSREEVENHPAYKASVYKDLEFYDTSAGTWPYPSNWEAIEDNIRNDRPPLPIHADGVRTVRGEVEVQGSRVYVNDGTNRLRIYPRSVANQIDTFEGLEVTLRGTVDDDELTVDEVLAPVEEAFNAEVSVDGSDVQLSTDEFEVVSTQGTPARVLRAQDGERVRVQGWVFKTQWGDREHVVLNRVFAVAKEDLDLRRPSGQTLPAGSTVELTYVTSTGRRAIFKHADGWGWVSSSDLDLPAAAATGNASGLMGGLGN